MQTPLTRRLAGVALAATLAAGPATVPAAVFFSEYVEGTGSNKALEIYNAGSAAVDLAGFEVRVFANGSATVSGTLTLTGRSLDPGGTLVIAHPSSVASLLAHAQMISGILNYNGDDAVVLWGGGSALDRIGQVGFDPGDAWVSGPVSTLNQTLRRLPEVLTGDTLPTTAFDPAAGWRSYPVDTFDGLGQHSIVSPSPVPLPPSLGLLGLALGGLGLLRRRSGGRSPCLRPAQAAC
ncbi:MAG: lamin tail domain-containing protein [Gammaproteobacteria bacterium]|jgi:hypothetical protein|nr:lamin tail domain-containing protein [Gammaproteobacteria bacterium]